MFWCAANSVEAERNEANHQNGHQRIEHHVVALSAFDRSPGHKLLTIEFGP